MKKLISLLLVICMLCPLFVGCANQDEDYKMKKKYLRQFKIEDKAPEDVIIDYDGGTYNGARIVMLDTEWHDPEKWTETVDEVEIKYYDPNRLYAYKNGKFFTLTDAYDKNKLSREDIVAIGEEFNQQVTAYIDTCDKWDFDSCENIEFGNDHLDYYNRIVCNQIVWLRIDNKISPNASDDNSDTQKLIEYINSNVGMDLISPKPIGMFGYDPYWKCLVGEFILKNVTMDNLYTIMEKLSLVPGIKHVACHCLYVSIATQTANDEYYSDYQWGLDSIEIEKVWDFTTGSLNVAVGVIDSGINQHNELIVNYNLKSGYDFFYDVPIYPDFELGIEYPVDEYGHGTRVAGVIGALGNNNDGISGVAWNVSLVPYKIYISNSQAAQNFSVTAERIENAIYSAKNSYIDILNISLLNMMNYTSVRNQILYYPGLVVYSSGNENENIDENTQYYGFFDADNEILDNVIVVGAIDEYGNRWYEVTDRKVQGSNYGQKIVEIYAPGVNIKTTTSDGGYVTSGGTSYAAPFVSGVAALLLSINPNLTGVQLKKCIINGADNITIMVGDNNDISQSAKKLNAWGAFKYLMNNYYTYHETVNIGAANTSYSGTDTIESINSYSTFKENTSFIRLNVQTTGDYIFNVSADKDITTVLYDVDFEPIAERSSYQSGIDFTYYLTAGRYYLKTNVIESESILANWTTTNISYSINYTPHTTHRAVSYDFYSSTLHYCICGCGNNMGTAPHVVVQSEVVNNIAFCKHCGTRVILDDNFGQIGGILNISKVTINGSYILPNGIIVLVDEDIEAYENGTLVWYDKDKLPQTQ